MISYNNDPKIGNHLKEIYFCDSNYKAVWRMGNDIVQTSKEPTVLTNKIFMFVIDKIIFGGDHWQVKALETLQKG